MPEHPFTFTRDGQTFTTLRMNPNHRFVFPVDEFISRWPMFEDAAEYLREKNTDGVEEGCFPLGWDDHYMVLCRLNHLERRVRDMEVGLAERYPQ